MSHEIIVSFPTYFDDLVNNLCAVLFLEGTSNWSGDYFLTTAGVGLVISQHAPPTIWKAELQNQLREVFNRDWNSEFAVKLADLGHHPNCAIFNPQL